MARSPYQGTWQSGIRPTVVHAPDALVYINGESDIIGCPSCRRSFDINRYVTNISVDLNVDSPPGSASVSLSIPRHAIDTFFFERKPLVTEMMEIEIYAKGFFLVEGVPQYYPIFWGLITEVQDNFSGGEHTVSLSCNDILKWWELCRMNINPAFTAAAGQQGRSIFGNVFFGMNPYDVIWTVAQQAFGDVIVGSGSLVSLSKEQGGQKKVFVEALADLMAYWSNRFSRIRSNLLLYGTQGVAVRGDTLNESMRSGKSTAKQPFASTAVRNANGGAASGQMVFDPTDPSVVAFRTQFNNAGQVNFWSSEYQTKLELANAAKEVIGFELFMDVTGDIVFKPPFYNLDVLSNKPVSWIQDIDIIDWNFSQSEAEVVTQVQMQGSYAGTVDYGFPEEATPFTSVTDYHLLRKYGWRTHSYNSEFMGDPQLMFYHGMDILDRINSKRHRASISIPFRPELRLGFPVYVYPVDQVWYLSGLSHQIAMGGRAQTTLTLTARRDPFLAPKGIGTLKLKSVAPEVGGNQGSNKPNNTQKTAAETKDPFKYTSRRLAKSGSFTLQVGAAATLPATIDVLDSVSKDNPYDPLILRHPKTGRVLGCPNVTMVYTRPFAPQPDDLAKKAGQKGKNQPYISKETQKKLENNLPAHLTQLEAQYTRTKEDELRDKHLNNRFQYGLNSAGVFVYARDTSQVISEMLLMPAANITATNEQGAPVNVVAGQTAMIRPVSDDRGYELIGHFRYGRGLSLRDGRLINTTTTINPGSPNAPASIDVQLAVSGDLFATLTAQSLGLVSVASAYPNPAETLARLMPEDLQTGAAINPETKQPEFINTAPNFVDTAPLGSPQQAGFNLSVEASQLSRALTLAELQVLKDGEFQDNGCQCLLGRSDLAFMSSGYQVKILKGTVPDNSSLFGVVPAGTPGESTQIGGTAATNNAIAQGLPVADSIGVAAITDPTQAAAFVNGFLYDLYSALDTPHQAYEAALRGEALNLTLANPADVRAGGTFPESAPNSAITPPYSASSRAAIGDPAAIAVQGSSAKGDIASSWNDFGNKLKANTDRARLQGELNLLLKQEANITAQVAKLSQQRQSATPAEQALIDATLTDLQGQLASIDQQIKQHELALAQLPA